MVLLLALIFALRVWELPNVPPGITHDEASNAHDSAAILAGEHRIYFPVGYGHEPLYNYSVALATAILGRGIFSLRITSVTWGWFQVIATVALARRWWGRAAATAVAAAYAASFWSLMMARVGLRATALPALLAFSVLSYDHAIHPRKKRARQPTDPTREGASGPGRPRVHKRGHLPPVSYYGAAGLFLGASLYTYMASRGMPLLYVVFLLALALLDRNRLRAIWRGTLAVVAVAALVSAPLFIYLYQHPDLEQRIGQLGGAIAALRRGDWRPLAQNVADSLPLLLVRGDGQWLYNVADRPGLEPLLAVCFVVGLVYALWHWRREHTLLALIWLLGGVAPALLVSADYNLLHAIAAMPAVMLLVGVGAVWSGRWLYRSLRRRRGLGRAVGIFTVTAFLATTASTARAYFVTWSGNHNVRVAYHHHVVSLGRYLENAEAEGPAVITTLYPGEFHDPYAMEATRGRHDQALRWADGRTALFIPETRAKLFVEAQTQPPEPIWHWIQPDLVPLVRLSYRPIDIPSRTDGYVWNAPMSWERLTTHLEDGIAAAPGDPPPTVEHLSLTCPIRYGDTASLIGYRWADSSLQAGKTVSLLTGWEVLAPTEQELSTFAHLLNPTGDLIAQDDRLDAPAWQWQAGDRWVQLHQLSLPGDLPSGNYWVALGLYDRQTRVRLPLKSDAVKADPVATRVLIPLELSAP